MMNDPAFEEGKKKIMKVLEHITGEIPEIQLRNRADIKRSEFSKYLHALEKECYLKVVKMKEVRPDGKTGTVKYIAPISPEDRLKNLSKKRSGDRISGDFKSELPRELQKNIIDLIGDELTSLLDEKLE